MKNNTYVIADLSLAACLVLKGFRVDSMSSISKGRVGFEFERTKPLEELVLAYSNYDCHVDAQSYFNRIKSLKSQIYNQLTSYSK